MNFTEILGIKFANADIAEAVEYAMRSIPEKQSICVVAPDSEMMHEIHESKRLREAVQSAELILPEGNGVMLAADIMGRPLRMRMCAIDFASALMARMSEKHMSIYILGDDSDTVEMAELNMSERYPGLKIAGRDDGFYYDDDDLIEAINASNSDMLLVCREPYRQEIWMARNKDSINTGLILGLGEGIGYFAGKTQRAPKRWRDSGFEWLYWIIKDPRRLLRTLKRSWIIFAALGRRLFGN